MARDPLTDGTLAAFPVHPVAMTSLTLGAVEPTGVAKKDGERAKNMFALGLLSWMYNRPAGRTEAFLRERFAGKPDIAEAKCWRSGRASTTGRRPRRSPRPTRSRQRALPAGTYRQITGNTALAYGIVAAGDRSGLPVFLGTYPITPASDILHELSKHKRFGVTTFQAEDEIAGIGAALGASLGGALGVTSTSGPGLALKSETIGLAVMTELPLVVIDVQRGGPVDGAADQDGAVGSAAGDVRA